MRTFVLVAVLAASPAFAGSDSRRCVSIDGRIVMTSDDRVQIKVGKKPKVVLDKPIALLPNYDWTPADAGEQMLIAVPISNERFVKKNHRTMHVVQPDGRTCEGRELVDDVTLQRYVVMARDGRPLFAILGDTVVPGLTSDGYLVAQFRCEITQVSSPGGCHPEDGSRITLRRSK